MPLYDLRCEQGHRFERFIPLARIGDQQCCDCGKPAERLVSAPRVISDTIDPIRGADGKMHTSISSYRHSLTPDGNPRGERFTEMGNQELPAFEAPKFDRRERREHIKAGIEDVKNGRVPPVVTGDLP